MYKYLSVINVESASVVSLVLVVHAQPPPRQQDSVSNRGFVQEPAINPLRSQPDNRIALATGASFKNLQLIH